MSQNNVIPFPAQKTGSNGNSVSSTTNNAINNNLVSAQILEISSFLPEGKETIKLIETSKGTQQIPHKIFEFMIKATNSRIELVVFACLLRFTIGFHRSSCEASHTFIALWTGLSVTSIRRGLDELISAKLIHRLGSGNSFKESTIYEIPIVKAYLGFVNTQNQNNKPFPNESSEQNPAKTKSTQLYLQGAQYHADSRHSTLPSDGTKKDNTNINKEITTLSQLEQSDFLKNYFLTLKPKQKQMKEWGHFQSLKNSYDIQDISDAIKLLVTEGIPNSGESCHSPMAFLSHSMDGILSILKIRREKAFKRENQIRTEQERRQLEAKKEAEEKAEFVKIIQLFEKSFPSEKQREEFFAKFSTKYPFFPKNSIGLKNAAISEWASQQNY